MVAQSEATLLNSQARHESFASDRIVRASYRRSTPHSSTTRICSLTKAAQESRCFHAATPIARSASSSIGSRTAYVVLAGRVADLHFGSSIGNVPASCAVALFGDSGNRIDNISDWALSSFRDHYKNVVTPAKAEVSAFLHHVEGEPTGCSPRILRLALTGRRLRHFLRRPYSPHDPARAE
ncbi:MAG: hypothetical protein U1F23_07500 [Lysobacterales bacterium]